MSVHIEIRGGTIGTLHICTPARPRYRSRYEGWRLLARLHNLRAWWSVQPGDRKEGYCCLWMLLVCTALLAICLPFMLQERARQAAAWQAAHHVAVVHTDHR